MPGCSPSARLRQVLIQAPGQIYQKGSSAVTEKRRLPNLAVEIRKPAAQFLKHGRKSD